MKKNNCIAFLVILSGLFIFGFQVKNVSADAKTCSSNGQACYMDSGAVGVCSFGSNNLWSCIADNTSTAAATNGSASNSFITDPNTTVSNSGSNYSVPDVLEQTTGNATPSTSTAATASTASTAVSGGLVPCGTGSTPCTLCDFIVGFSNLTKYLLGLAVTIALAGITFAGIMYVISSGDEGLITTSKNFLKASISGFVIVLCAWLIVNVAMWALSAKTDLNIGKTNWYTFDCSS